MPLFDITQSASRQTEFARSMRDMGIKRELEKQMGSTKKEEPAKIPTPDQAYTMLPESKSFDLLPLPMQTVKWESRTDSMGNPIVYKLPEGDQGGRFEISGINDRYHPEAFKAISALPPEQRAEAAAEYIRAYTAPLVAQLPRPIQAFTQDLAFNRGLGGATRYIQQGLNSLGQDIPVDGVMGPRTLQAIQSVQPRALMQAASQAQIDDEYRKAEIDPRRKKFISGLENRVRNRFSLFGV